MLALRYLDIVILILALPIFLAADLPMLGYAAAAVAWLVAARDPDRAHPQGGGRGRPADGRRASRPGR